MMFKERLREKINQISPLYQKLFLDIGSISLSTVISRILLLIRDFLLASILGPASYGVWTQMVVVFSYALHLPIGFQNAMSREVPYYLGQEKPERARTIQSIVFVVMVSTGVLAAVSILIAYWVFGYRLLGFSLSALILVGIVVIVQQVYAYFSILLRARQRFSAFSIGFAGFALLSLIFACIASRPLGANGVALAQGVAYIFVIGYWLSRIDFWSLQIRFPWQEFLRLFRLAIPLFIVGLSGLLITSMDRLVVTIIYNEEQTGYYGLAFLVSQSISLLVTPIVQAISPRLMDSYGRHGEPKKVEHYLTLLTIIMGSVVALLIGVVYLLIGDLLPVYLPQYGPSVSVTRNLLVGSIFFALAIGANSFLIAIDKQRQIIKIQAVVIVLQAALIGIIVQRGGSIEQVAVAAAASYVVYGTLVLISSKLNLGDSALKAFGFWLRSCLPASYVIICAILVSQWNPLDTANEWLNTVVHLGIWTVMIIPAGLYLIRVLRRSTGKLKTSGNHDTQDKSVIH